VYSALAPASSDDVIRVIRTQIAILCGINDQFLYGRSGSGRPIPNARNAFASSRLPAASSRSAATGGEWVGVDDPEDLPDTSCYVEVNCHAARQLAGIEARADSAIRLRIRQSANAVYQADLARSGQHEAVRAPGELVGSSRAVPLEQVAGAVVLQAGVKGWR